MYPVSADFLATIGHSHRVKSVIELWPDGVAYPTTITNYVVGGSVTIDARRQNRRQIDLTIVDPAGVLVPGYAGDALSPMSGTEIKAYRGCVLSDGTTELVPLGVFRITGTEMQEGSNGVVMTVNGTDRSWRIQRSLFSQPYSIANGTPIEEAIVGILADRYPAVMTNLPVTGQTTPLTVLGPDGGDSSDPWAAAQKLATDSGWDLYFDATGTAVMTRTADLTSASSVFTYSADAARMVTEATRSWDAESIYNGVIVTGEGTSVTTPARGEAWDTDPDSATYRYGPLGEMPEMYSTPLALTADAANAVAAERLRRRLGAGAALSWNQLVNPAHEGSDVVTVIRPGLKVSDLFIIDSMTIPLMAADSASAVGRTRLTVTE